MAEQSGRRPPRSLLDGTLIDRSLVDPSLVDRSLVDRSLVDPEDEMTVMAQAAPRPRAPLDPMATIATNDPPVRPAPKADKPDPLTQQPGDEGTMMMDRAALPITAAGAPKKGLPTHTVNLTGFLQNGANPALPNTNLPNTNLPQSRAWAQPAQQPPAQQQQPMQQQPMLQQPMQQQPMQMPPQKQPSVQQQGPMQQQPMQMPPMQQPPMQQQQPMQMQRPPMQVAQPGPQMQGVGNYRAAPPPVGPPGIVLQGSLDERLVLIAEPESARATSFRLLRDNLLAKRMPRVLAVSSPLKGDGKTTCAVNLALSLSEGARVLLLDGNLERPALHTIFRIDESTPPSPVNGPWSSPYKIAEYSPTFHVAALHALPGVTPPRFERRWFEQLMGALRRSHYDFILIDSAALEAESTVSQLVATADATLLAVRAGVTTARALRRASEQISEGKAIGVALLDAKTKS